MAKNQRSSAVQPIEYPSRRKTRASKLRLVASPKKRPSAEVAAERIKTLIFELGEGERFAFGWKRRAYEQLGLCEQTGYKISTGRGASVGTRVMDQICNKIGITIAELMDED